MSGRYSNGPERGDVGAYASAPVPLKAPTSHRVSRRHRRRRRRIAIAVVCVLAFAAVTAGSAYAFTSLIEQGRLNLLTMQDAQIETGDTAVTTDAGKTVEYNGHHYRLNENMVSLCIIGRDKELHAPDEGFNGQADFIMALAIDSSTGKTTGIIVPRDSMVDVDVNYIATDELYKTERLQLAVAYAYGTDDASSSELVARAVSRTLYNIPLDFYYTISMDGVYELANVADGVAIEALQTIPGTDIVEGGMIKLEGENAMKYVQWRDTDQMYSALDRQARQMQFIKALAAKSLSIAKGNPAALIDMYNIVTGYATTNLTASEVSYLATILANDSSSFETISLKGESAYNDESIWEQYLLDRESVYQTVLDVYYTQID